MNDARLDYFEGIPVDTFKRIKFTVGERDDEDLHQLRSDLLIHGACLHRVDKEGKIKRIDPKDWERDDLDET